MSSTMRNCAIEMESVPYMCVGKTVLLADFINFAFPWSGVKPGFCWIRRPAAPETTGVAMLVPLSLRYEFDTPVTRPKVSWLIETRVRWESVQSVQLVLESRDMMPLPGATMSGFTV